MRPKVPDHFPQTVTWSGFSYSRKVYKTHVSDISTHLNECNENDEQRWRTASVVICIIFSIPFFSQKFIPDHADHPEKNPSVILNIHFVKDIFILIFRTNVNFKLIATLCLNFCFNPLHN